MKMRMIAAWVVALAVLGPGVAARGRAQGPGLPRPADPNQIEGERRAVRVKLRARVASLRAEVEWLQIEHDLERAVAKAVINGEGRANADSKKGEFIRQTAVLNEKKLELEDLEAEYRESGSPARPKDRLTAAGVDPAITRVSTVPALSAGSCVDPDRQDCVPILDPVADAGTAPCCVYPPTEAELWRELCGSKQFGASSAARRPLWMMSTAVKVGETVDACKVYPLAGPCRLVHCHYKGVVSFHQVSLWGAPIPSCRLEPRDAVVYLDKDHLVRCGGPADGHPSHRGRGDGPAVEADTGGVP